MDLDLLQGLQRNVAYRELQKYRKARIVSALENLRVRTKTNEDVYAQEFNKGYLLGLEEDLLELMIEEQKQQKEGENASN